MVLEFEKPIADLELKLQEMIHLANEKNIDLSTDIQSLEEKLQILKRNFSKPYQMAAGSTFPTC